MMDKQFINNL